jgi:short-subunit dehydrogenase
MQLKDARILLTGATGGLGRELARGLAQAGAHLLLAGRDAARLAEVAAGVGGTGVSVKTILADLNQDSEIERVTLNAQGFGINVLINNAGVNAFALFEQQHWADVQRVLDTNLAMPMHLTQALLPHIKAQPRGAVVNIGSTFGSLPFPGFAAYSTAKAGLRAFSQSLRRELADSGVEVIHVAPRAIATALNTAAVNALNRELGSASDAPEAAARQIVAAIGRGRGETHLGFPERLFAWLNGCAPRMIDRALVGKLAIVKRHLATLS